MGARDQILNSTGPPVDDELIIVDVQHVLHSVWSNVTIIIGFTFLFIVLVALGVLLGGVKNQYRSEAKLLYNPSQVATVVSNVETGNVFFSTKGSGNSVFKNQQEVFQSRLLSQRVLADLSKKGIRFKNTSPEKFAKNYLQTTHIRDTDFMRLFVTADSPKLSHQVISSYLKNYSLLMDDLTNAPLKEQENLYTEQLQQAEKELTTVENRLKHYQRSYGIVDIAAESQSKVNELETLSIQTKNIQASLAEKQAEAQRIRSQLSMQKGQTTSNAILSVANGQNSLLHSLKEQLQTVEKDFLAKSKIFAQSNPDMVALKTQIDILNQQVAEQQRKTLGQKLPGTLLQIQDKVRSSMVAQLASSESQAAALSRKLSISQGQVNVLQEQLKDMPEKQIDYIRLKLHKDNKENIVTRLREKLAEVKIQKAAIGQKLQVIDPPSLPNSAMFPNCIHMMILAGLSGALLSTLFFVVRDMISPRIVSPVFVEQVFKIPILAVIPWLPDSMWKRQSADNTLAVLSSPVDTNVLNSYQDFALSLKAQCHQGNNINALTVASAFLESDQRPIIANLAYCLAQSGDRVVIVDVNLRKPHIHELFQHELNYDAGLTELINVLSETLYLKPDASGEDLMKMVVPYVLPSHLHPQLHYINAGVQLENTFEFLNSKGFASLVNTLKGHYEWVLFNSPPFLSSPDSSVGLSYMDGLLLTLEREVSKSQVQSICNKMRKLNSKIIGCTMRGT